MEAIQGGRLIKARGVAVTPPAGNKTGQGEGRQAGRQAGEVARH